MKNSFKWLAIFIIVALSLCSFTCDGINDGGLRGSLGVLFGFNSGNNNDENLHDQGIALAGIQQQNTEQINYEKIKRLKHLKLKIQKVRKRLVSIEKN